MTSKSSIQDLEQAIVESLNRRGVLNQMQANLRCQIYKSITVPDSIQDDQLPLPPPLEIQIMNWLINEYLEYNQFGLTKSVLQKECAMGGSACLSRHDIELKLNVNTQGTRNEKIPLLYSLIFNEKPSHHTSA